MCDFQVKVHEILECPICNRLPRKVPVVCCMAGHIVCDHCVEADVIDCPQCREQMFCTNTVAGQLASICVHPCSYDYLGCPVGLNMDEIEAHEKICPERTVKCIFRECNREIQLKNFEAHVMENTCAINLQHVAEYEFVTGVGMLLPYVINRQLQWNGTDDIVDTVFPHKDDGNWRLMAFKAREVTFYVSFSYSATREAFIIYILMADSVAEAEKYKAKIWIETLPDENGDSENKMGFLQNVVSVEDTRDLDGDLPNSKYLVIPYSEMKQFFSITKNKDDPLYPEETGKYTVVVPVQVQDVLNVT